MEAKTIDPYSFAAGRLPAQKRDAIRAFWSQFEANAEGIDQCFNSRMDDMTVDPTEVMDGLKAVSPALMWEFGPSERGHALMITAEWHDENRALARAVNEMAPTLDRWVFHEVRGPISGDVVLEDYFRARSKETLSLNKVISTVSPFGRINLTGYGTGKSVELADQAWLVASMILGEEIERDWVGGIDVVPRKERNFLSWRRQKEPAEAFDATEFSDGFRDAISKAKSAMPTEPYSNIPLETRAATLFKADNLPSDHPRADLIVFTAMTEAYGMAILSKQRFSSRCHSWHNEWFCYLRIERSQDSPFDNVDDRYALEACLHASLSKDGLGGVVSAGHGREAVYIDFAATDIAQAIARIEQELKEEPCAKGATLHLLDEGLQGMVFPVCPSAKTIN